MSPQEVGGLQKIAMAAGGSLTINPHTGLPEAGWLSSLLPLLAGGIATFFTGGAAAPWMAALAGAGTGALTGDKNLPLWERLGMGALGGWGGGNILGALQGAGTATAGNAAAEAAKNLGAAQTAGAASLADIVPTAAPLAEGASAYGATTAANVAAANAAAETAANTAANLGTSQAAYNAAAETVKNSVANPSALSGLKGLASEQGRQGFMQVLKASPFGTMGTAAAAAAPTLMEPQQSINAKSENPWYYTAAPGYSSLYNPGKVNPNIAKLGYLPQGQQAFIGQGWNPGVYTHNYPGVPASSPDNPLIGAKAGGLMGIRRFDQGGSTSGMGSTLSSMNDYYKNILNKSQAQNAMTPTVTTPSPDAMNEYLAKTTEMITPQPYSEPQPAAPTTAATPGATGTKPPFDLSALQGMMGGMGGMWGGSGPSLPTYTYDPVTGKYTQTSGGMGGRLGGFHMAQGGLTPNYAAGGKLLKGDGDGMSDSIPAVIGGQKPQRAALADGEFVVPADVVSHIGNGSTNAGAKRLYAMMDKIRQARTGNPHQGKQINPNKFLPV
jgi:hypothetical protein